MISCIGEFKEVIGWFNANQGFCMVLLTLALSVCAWLSYRISVKTMREQNRPHVIVAPCFFDHEIYFGVSLRNTGFSTAYDIRFKWERVPTTPWPKGREDEVKFLVEPVASLRAGVGYKCYLGPIRGLKEVNEKLVYRGRVSYKDSTGKKYREDVCVDFRMFENRGVHPDDGDSDLVKVLSRINDQLWGIRRGADHFVNKDTVARMFPRHTQRSSERADVAGKTESVSLESSQPAGQNTTDCQETSQSG